MRLCKRLGCIVLTSAVLCGTFPEILPATAWAIEANTPTIELVAEQPVSHTMKIGESVRLTARKANSSGDHSNTGSGENKDNGNIPVTVTRWASDNEGIAAVSQDGIVTAIGVGTTRISGACEDGVVICDITVYSGGAASLTLNLEKETMYVGETQQITPILTPSEASKDTQITWSSSNTSVLTVSDTGKVTAVGTGQAIIAAVTSNGVSATHVIKVPGYRITGISLSTATLNLAAGGQAALTASVYPAQANAQVTWSTSNAAVAIVNNSGRVTAINTGVAVITAMAGNVHATCIVKVYSNTVSNGKVTIAPGTSTFTGTTGTAGTTGTSGTTAESVYIPGTTVVSPNDMREYTMPAHIPSLAFLTVDSDLSGNTSQILAQLKMYGISATFFVPIDNLYNADSLLREIVGEGHSIGLLLTAQQAADGNQAVAFLDKANQQLSVITGTPTRLVRVSGGSSAAGVTQESLQALQQGGYSLWDWNSAPENYQAAAAALDQENAVTLRFDSNAASAAATLQQLLPYIQYCGIPAKPLSAGDTPVCQIS